MAPKRSAGLLMYRSKPNGLEVFLGHPGGPYFAGKNEGIWTIPKGQYKSDEHPLAAATREFLEETGFEPSEPFIELGTIRQKSGKLVTAWAFEGDCNPDQLTSNTCEVEWPPRSGKRIEIPEIDRGEWFSLANAKKYIRPEQIPLLEALTSIVG